jgi:hypothetical protein
VSRNASTILRLSDTHGLSIFVGYLRLRVHRSHVSHAITAPDVPLLPALLEAHNHRGDVSHGSTRLASDQVRKQDKKLRPNSKLKPRSGLVSYSSIIWYGYSQAVVESAPKPEDPSKKLRAILSKMYPERPDLWVGRVEGYCRRHLPAVQRQRHCSMDHTRG